MKINYMSRFIAALGGLFFFFTTTAVLAQIQVLHGHVPAIVKSLAPLENLPGTNHLNLAIGLPLRNQAALSNLLQQIYDPASPHYRHYLTPEEFTAQFGPAEADYQKVIQFAQANGLTVTKTHGNRMLVDVTGSVHDVEKAFHVTLQVYRHPMDNRTFFAPDTEPSLDSVVPVLHVSGLDNYSLPKPLLHQMSASQATPASGSGLSGSYVGNDFRNAYVPGTSLNGSGQMVGLLQFDSGFYQSDITTYETLAGLPNVPVQPVLLDGYGGGPGIGNDEVSLDIEMVISMAPGVSQIYVFEGINTDDILNAMAASNQVKQLSASWSYSIDATSEQIFQQFAAQGQSFFNASGDDDAWLAGQISTPCDDPYITIVGGTTLSTANNAWTSETVWNWGTELGRDGIGSGGGISTTYAIPSWQTNINMTANQGSKTFRNIPDVALTGDNVFVAYGNGAQGIFGGTSCATPLWAGFMALVNQQAAATGEPPVGFANPAIYSIAKGANYTSVFHDITTGNNTWSGSPTEFYAVSGYDLCTGWGTPAGQNLINALANPEPLLITPPTGFTSSGGFGGPFTITSQNLSLTNTGTNFLTWTLANTSAWLTVSSRGGTLPSDGPATPVTVSLNDDSSNLVVGIYNATVWFTNLSDNFGQGRQFTLSVLNPPGITLQPTNQAVLEGAMATFTVAAIGSLPLSYQWQDIGTNLTDGGKVSGSMTTNLVISNVSANDVGTYKVVVTNAAGSAISSNALLTLKPSRPIIVQQPSNETTVVDETAEFTVNAIGTTPYSYQWSFNTTNIVGATNATLMLTNVQLTNAGSYSVVVTNAHGSAISSNAVLTVLLVPPCYPAPSGLVAWWQGEGNANDSVGTNNGILMGGVSFSTGEVDQAFNFNGSNAYVLVSSSPSIKPTGSFTIEAWANYLGFGAGETGDSIVTKGQDAEAPTDWAMNISTYQKLRAHINVGGTWYYYDGAATLNTNTWYHVAMVYDGTNLLSYVNGIADGSMAVPGILQATDYPLKIGAYSPINGVQSKDFFNGLIDEVSFYNRALTAAEIQAIFNAGSEGKCPVPPTILVQPTNQTVSAGGLATFTVQAVGTQPLNYQWSLNGTNVSSATNTSLTLTNAQLTNAGSYSVTVTNFYGSATSSNVMLTVLTQPPIISNQPTNQIAFVGGTANFSVTATGSLPLSYQWSFNGTNIVGATNISLMLVNVQLTNAGLYSVALTNAYGSAISSNAVLTVNPPPSCDPAPSGLVAWWRAEGNANDSIGTNNGTPVGGVSYTNGEVGQAFLFDNVNTLTSYIPLPASPSLNIGTNGGLTIECWIKPDAAVIPGGGPIIEWDSATSDGTQLWVGLYASLKDTSGVHHFLQAPPGLLNTNSFQHIAVTYDKSSGKAFLYYNGTVVVSNNFGNITPQTSYPLNIGRRTAQITADGSNYGGLIDELSLYNRALSSSEIAAIYATGSGGKCPPSAPFIAMQPTNQAVALGSTPTFTVMAGGTAPLRYQWNFNRTNIAWATNLTLVVTNVQLNQAGNYAVLVTNAYGSILSSNATLVVNPLLYFAWNQVPSPRFANAPFTVVIQAQNLTNGIVTNFTSTAILMSTNGVPVKPAVSGSFFQGVWTGAVTVAQTATNLVLQAKDNLGESGLANPINVISLPALTTAPSGNTLYIFWPVNPSGFVLETSAGLSPANWVPVTIQPFPIGDQYLLPIQMSGTNAFYRLRYNGQ